MFKGPSKYQDDSEGDFGRVSSKESEQENKKEKSEVRSTIQTEDAAGKILTTTALTPNKAQLFPTTRRPQL